MGNRGTGNSQNTNGLTARRQMKEICRAEEDIAGRNSGTDVSNQAARWGNSK
jgi:hypothetical protein